MVAIFHVYNNKILSKPYDPAGQIRKYWGSVEATNHINDVTSMKDRLDVTHPHLGLTRLSGQQEPAVVRLRCHGQRHPNAQKDGSGLDKIDR